MQKTGNVDADARRMALRHGRSPAGQEPLRERFAGRIARAERVCCGPHPEAAASDLGSAAPAESGRVSGGVLPTLAANRFTAVRRDYGPAGSALAVGITALSADRAG